MAIHLLHDNSASCKKESVSAATRPTPVINNSLNNFNPFPKVVSLLISSALWSASLQLANQLGGLTMYGILFCMHNSVINAVMLTNIMHANFYFAEQV